MPHLLNLSSVCMMLCRSHRKDSILALLEEADAEHKAVSQAGCQDLGV